MRKFFKFLVPAALLPAALLLVALLWWRASRPFPPTPAAPSTATAPASTPVAPTAAPAPTAALTRALALPQPRERALAFGTTFQAWAQADPDAALAHVRQLPPGNERSQSLLMVLEFIGRRDPDRALALAHELIATRDERAFYSSLFDRLARENIGEAIPRLAAAPVGEAHENALRALTDAWVRLDPAAAQRWALALPDRTERTVAAETVLLDLASRDPAQAIALAASSLGNPALDRVVLHAVQQLSPTAPERAAEFVSLLAAGESRVLAAAAVARALSAKDPAAALAWSQTLPAGNTRTAAVNSALAVWAARDAAAAAVYVLTRLTGPSQQSATLPLVSLWAPAHPQAAVAWAQSLAAPESRATALVQIASAWAQRDPSAATRWAATQGDLPPAALRGAVSYWMLQDAAAAQAWIESANLPSETKAQLRGGAR